MSDHALSVTAAALGRLVLGPRKAAFAVLRNLAPLLLVHGVTGCCSTSMIARLPIRANLRIGD